jgi:hypothetical protein
MKTKKYFALALVMVALIGITISGCKKKSTDSSAPDTTSASLQQLSADENNVTQASDDAMNDACTLASSAKGIESGPCDATVTLTTSGDTIIKTVTFNGSSCPGHMHRSRSGEIIVKRRSNTDWSQQGATVWVAFIDYKVTRNSKSVTINGTKSFTNVTGHLISELNGTVTAVQHRVSGSVHVVFDNGNSSTSRTWNIARQRTYSGIYPDQMTLTIEGFGSASTYSNLVTWGTNRNNEDFYTQINTPIVCRQICEWDPISGVKVQQIPSDSKSATLTFGYNDSNQPIGAVSTASDCPTKYKVDWVKNGNSGTVYLFL